MNEIFIEAPPEHVWVCGACGKTSRTRSGWAGEKAEIRAGVPGWDESCMLNAVLCWSDKKDGVWQSVEENSE